MRRNSPNETNEDYNASFCKRCNFPIDFSRDKESPRSSITYTALSGHQTGWPYNFTVNKGCPFCGCVNYRNWTQ